jgi:hypothetical protein
MTDIAPSSDLENVLRRVHKLLAIAGDDRANAAEAAAAAGQAEKIMRKYQIEHADVITASLQRDDSFDSQDIGGTMNPSAVSKSTTIWAGMLSLAVARLHDCRASWVSSPALGVCLRYCGYKSDTQVALWTHLYVVNQLVSALRRHQKEHASDRQDSERFRKGFIIAVVTNINQSIEAKRAEMSQEVASRSLVVVKAQAVSERFGRQKERSNRFSSGGDAFQRGHAEGCKVNIGRRGVADHSAQAVGLN